MSAKRYSNTTTMIYSHSKQTNNKRTLMHKLYTIQTRRGDSPALRSSYCCTLSFVFIAFFACTFALLICCCLLHFISYVFVLEIVALCCCSQCFLSAPRKPVPDCGGWSRARLYFCARRDFVNLCSRALLVVYRMSRGLIALIVTRVTPTQRK